MFDPFSMRVMHPHGDEMVEMRRREVHDAAEHDPERDWIKHGHVYECACGEKVIIAPDHSQPEPSKH